MATPTAVPSAAQSRHTLSSLYRLLLRTSQSTFQGDQRMISAWRTYVRQKLPAQLEGQQQQQGGATVAATKTKLSDEFVNEWLDVVKMLRMNVVQGVRESEEEAFRLRFTADTELGSNESIKAGRSKQLEDLRASKGSLGCGGASRPNVGSSSSPSSSRAFSTTTRLLDPRSADKLQPPRHRHVPHPPPHFPTLTVLADGSTINMMSTLPRSVTHLTRDPTNHPLWNPNSDRRSGSGQDEAGRVNRFRKRFGGTDEDQASRVGGGAAGGRNAQILHKPLGGTANKEATSEASATKSSPVAEKPKKSTAQTSASPQQPAAKQTAARSRSLFDLDDLDWMSAGAGGKKEPPAPKEKKPYRKK